MDIYIKVIDFVGTSPMPEQGIWFRNNVFYTNLIYAIENNIKVILDFDGTFDYPTTFIRDIFSDISTKTFKKYVLITNKEFDFLESEIKSFCKKKGIK